MHFLDQKFYIVKATYATKSNPDFHINLELVDFKGHLLKSKGGSSIMSFTRIALVKDEFMSALLEAKRKSLRP